MSTVTGSQAGKACHGTGQEDTTTAGTATATPQTSQRQQRTPQPQPDPVHGFEPADDILDAISSCAEERGSDDSPPLVSPVRPPTQDSIMAYAPPSPTPPWPSSYDDYVPESFLRPTPANWSPSTDIRPLSEEPTSIELSNKLSEACEFFQAVIDQQLDPERRLWTHPEEEPKDYQTALVESRRFVWKTSVGVYSPEEFRESGIHRVLTKVVATMDERFQDLAEFFYSKNGVDDEEDEITRSILAQLNVGSEQAGEEGE